MKTFINAGLVAGMVFSMSAIAADGGSHPTLGARNHDPAIVHERHGHDVTSTNWSGYALTGGKGSVTDVKGSWIVPAVTCTSTNAYSSFWVGIDGYNSNTVEQVGTDSDCQSGSPVYYAWFEFYPHPSFTIGAGTMTIKAGDVITAEVKDTGGGVFAVTITDGIQSFTATTKVKSAEESSAEWVIEAPYSGGVLPLADFSSVSFTADYATISGVNQTIGPFSKGNVDEITMVTSKGVIKSLPSGLSADNSSFTDAWVSAGP